MYYDDVNGQWVLDDGNFDDNQVYADVDSESGLPPLSNSPWTAW